MSSIRERLPDIFEIEKIHEHEIEEIFRKTATTSFEIDFLKRVLQMYNICYKYDTFHRIYICEHRFNFKKFDDSVLLALVQNRTMDWKIYDNSDLP